jgi:hypothetical protein
MTSGGGRDKPRTGARAKMQKTPWLRSGLYLRRNQHNYAQERGHTRTEMRLLSGRIPQRCYTALTPVTCQLYPRSVDVMIGCFMFFSGAGALGA